MKRYVFLLIFVFLASFGGTWHRCDDPSVRVKGKHPPAPHTSYGVNTTPDRYAEDEWCTKRAVERPELPEGYEYVRTKKVSKPYFDYGWSVKKIKKVDPPVDPPVDPLPPLEPIGAGTN